MPSINEVGGVLCRHTSKGVLLGLQIRYLNDISSVVDSLLATAASMSVLFFLMSHSIRGYVAESPYLNLYQSAKHSCVIAIAGRLAAKVLPKTQMYEFSGFIFPLMERVLSLETCLGSSYLSKHVPRPNPIPQTGNTDSEVLIQGAEAAAQAPNYQWEDNDLYHDTGTLEGLVGVLDRGDKLECDRVVGEDENCFWIGHGS